MTAAKKSNGETPVWLGVDEWDALVARSPHGTVFHNSWWLEATGRPFRILGVKDRCGVPKAGIVIPRCSVCGLRVCHSPPLTPYLGPVFDISECTKTAKALTITRRVGEALARAIPSCDSFYQCVGAHGPDLQGFLWAGYEARLRYTFQIARGQSIEQIRSATSAKHRSSISTARRRGEVAADSEDIESLILLIRRTYERQGRKIPLAQEDLVRRLWRAARSRSNAGLYLSASKKGKFSAGVATFFDKRSAYLLLAGGDPDLRSDCGGYLCVWESLKDAMARGLDFDFEGSQIRGVESNYRHWGGRAVPVFHLSKASIRGRVARAVRSRLMRLRNRIMR